MRPTLLALVLLYAGSAKAPGIIGPSDSKGPAMKARERRIIGPSDAK